MELSLRRPIAFFDIETTGLNVSSARIVEISVLKISPGGTEEWFCSRINPGIPIPPETTAVHGISDADVANAPGFREIARNLTGFLKGCDLAGYNALKFDLPVLAEEFLRLNIDFDFTKRKYIDVQVIFHKKEQRTLSAAYRFYCNKELEGAHSSKVDTSATFEVLKAQLDMYSDLPNSVDFLADYSTFNNMVDFAGRIILDSKGVEVFNFGKHKGKPVESVLKEDTSYYSWMMNGDFPLYTKKILTEIRIRMTGKEKRQ